MAMALLLGCATRAPALELACQQPLDPKIANSCVVSEQTLWRGARPDAESMAMLVDLGVRTVVSLELFQDDRKAFEDAKPTSSDAREVGYIQIRDWEPLVVLRPSEVDEHVAQFLAITRTQPKPIYVHCRSGQNRTGVMVAAYRIFEGADIEETIRDMQGYGGFWSKADADYLRTLTPERRALIEKQVRDWMPKVKRSARVLCAAGRCALDQPL